MNPAPPSEEKFVTEGKIFAVLSYLSILCILPLVLKKENVFVLSHAKQGLVIFVAQVGVLIISIPFPWLYKLSMFALGVISFIGIMHVLQGKYVQFPVISKIAEKIVL